MTSGPLALPPLLLAFDAATIKVLFFIAFLLLGGLGKLIEELGKAAERRRRAEKVGESSQSTLSTASHQERRAEPMSQSELEERLRKMLGRDPASENRASTPSAPTTSSAPRPIASPSSFSTAESLSKRARKEAKRKAAARAAEAQAQEARIAQSIARVREAQKAATRQAGGAPIRALLRGGNASVRQAFLLSEILNRKY